MRLNLGSGAQVMRGMQNLDPLRDGWRFQDGFPRIHDATVDGVTASHCLMYLPEPEWPALFTEVHRVLKRGGCFRITEDSTADPRSPRYGGYHDAVTLTTPQLVLGHMERAGFSASRVNADEGHDPELFQDHHGGEPKAFFVEGVKP